MCTNTSHNESLRPASKNQNLVGRVGRKSVGERASCRSAADDHEVVPRDVIVVLLRIVGKGYRCEA